MRELDLTLPGGRVLHAYDTADTEDAPPDRTVMWLHGTPMRGAPPVPLFEVAAELGVRWISYDRPGYGGSGAAPGRTVADAAADVAAVADAFGVGRFALFGSSGGATHGLGCAAALGERVSGVVAMSALAPIDAPGLDWFAGMGPSGEASLRAAVAGRTDRSVKKQHEAAAWDETSDSAGPDFEPVDFEAFAGPWGWLGSVAGPEAGMDGLIDDDLAYVTPWGADPAAIAAPVLLVHGTADRIVPAAHSRWLAEHIPSVRLEIMDGEGHISVLRHAGEALRRLCGGLVDGGHLG